MEQLEMGLKNTDKFLSANGYWIATKCPKIMTQRMERRFGRLMIKKAKADGMFNPYKNKRGALINTDKPTNGDIALDLAWGKGVTTKAFIKATGMESKSASNVMGHMVATGFLVVDPKRKQGRFLTWVLTPKGRDRVAGISSKKKGQGQRKVKVKPKIKIDPKVMLRLATLGVTSSQLADEVGVSVQMANHYLTTQLTAGNVRLLGRTRNNVNIYELTLQGEYVMKGGVI